MSNGEGCRNSGCKSSGTNTGYTFLCTASKSKPHASEGRCYGLPLLACCQGHGSVPKMIPLLEAADIVQRPATTASRGARQSGIWQIGINVRDPRFCLSSVPISPSYYPTTIHPLLPSPFPAFSALSRSSPSPGLAHDRLKHFLRPSGRTNYHYH